MLAPFKISKCFSFSFLLINKKKKQQCRFKRGRHHRASNENYIITSCRCYYQRGGRTMMVFPCYHHRSKEGEPWPAKPAVIIHSSSTNICLLRFRSYRKRGNDDFSLPPSFGESEPCKLSLQVYVKPFPALQRIYRNASRAVPERMNDRISLYHRS